MKSQFCNKKSREITSLENPDIMMELRASSHISQADIFQTWVAMLYSSMRGSLVK